MFFFQKHFYNCKKTGRFLRPKNIPKLFEQIISGISFRKFSRAFLASMQIGAFVNEDCPQFRRAKGNA